jgi:hypothetical protein
VLRDCGIVEGTTNASLLMCDGSQRFLSGPQSFDISNIIWDSTCDYVEFDCNFPGQPYGLRAMLGVPGRVVRVDGYLAMLDGSMPDCGISHDRLEGEIRAQRPCKTGPRTFVILDLRTPHAHLNGMSGAPVLARDEDGEHVVGALVGSLRFEGGGDFVAIQV